MKGILPRFLKRTLSRVEPQFNAQPVQTIVEPLQRLGNAQGFDFKTEYHRIPYKFLSGFSFDEICKMRFSSIIMMHESTRKAFERSLDFQVVDKILSSMWRWGQKDRESWNDVVDTYTCLANFTHDLGSDFEFRLDFARGNLECGYTKFTETYSDGSFAFHLGYKHEHVMTIGFSVLQGKQILIQQVQSPRRSGNRYLYRLPKNRIEFVIDLFRRNFPGFKLFVVDGKDLTNKLKASYQRSFDLYGRRPEHATKLLRSIKHLADDQKRLVSFYGNTGRYTLKREILVTANELTHYQVAA